MAALRAAAETAIAAERARLPHWPWFNYDVFALIKSGTTTAAEVARFWSLQPAYTFLQRSPFDQVPFGPAVQMLVATLGDRRLAWHPNGLEANVTTATATLHVTHPDVGSSHVRYGTAAPGPTWPRPIEVSRSLPPAVLIAVAFGGAENVPEHLRYLIHGQPEPATADAVATETIAA